MKENLWYQLLVLVDRLNRSVKEPGWRYEDTQSAYRMKDMVIEKLLREKPAQAPFQLFYCPYIRYSEHSKNAAGALMRADGNKYSFEYYLNQVPPSEFDREDPFKSSYEMVVQCCGQAFSFHFPSALLTEEYRTQSIPKKNWVPAPDFHHQQLVEAKRLFDEWVDALERE